MRDRPATRMGSGFLFTLLLCLPAPVAAAPWEVTRRTVIDPLNTALHRQLPSFVKARDLGGVLTLYATAEGTGLRWPDARTVYPEQEEETLRWEGPGGAEAIRARYEALFALFVAIDKAELRIDRVRWTAAGATGYPADVRLIVRGTRSDGSRAQLEQRAVLHVAPHDGRWVIAGEEITARTLVARREPAFVRTTEAAGIQNVHTDATSPPFHLFGGPADNPIAASSGSAVADVDGDGCEDVFLAGSPDAALYHNNCDGTFTDVTVAAGLPHPYPAAATGAVFFDYDNDGRPDLFVTAITGGNRLFHNLGGGRFEDVTARAHIPAGRWGSMATVADYDRDGFLDVYIVGMGDHEKDTPDPSYDARNGVGGTLLHNDGDGTFTDVTARAGVAHHGWDLAAAWADYDEDGWPDLYVGNEFGSNALYHNNGDGTFTDRAAASGTVDGGSTMGVAWGDYDGDGHLDLFVSNMHANSGWALFHPDFPLPIPLRFRLLGLLAPRQVRATAKEIVDRLVRGSSLYRNDGDGTFTDVSDAAGVRDGQWGWAPEFLDYDDDGQLDLYAMNGFVSGPILDDV